MNGLPSFVIVTNREVADQLESLKHSRVFNAGRSFVIGEISHYKSLTGGPGWSEIPITATSAFGIDPKDIFWLGRNSADSHHKIATV